jgi:hypothetical protein
MSQRFRWKSPKPPEGSPAAPGARNEKLKAERVERDFAFARQIGQEGAGEEMKPAGSRGGQPTTSPSRKEVVQR